MNVEQRLIDAFDRVERVGASPDLWTRVVHSIDEDRAHRRRVRRTALAIAVAAATFVVAVLASMTDGAAGRHVRWSALEIIETLMLVTVAAALAPAIRRFGRGYANDLWPHDAPTADALLRLLDVAYGLVLGGYVLLSVELTSDLALENALAGQLADVCARLGGMVLLVGVLHAVTIVTLPLMALVARSTLRGTQLPRWVNALLALLGIAVGFALLQLVGVLVAVGAS